MMPSRIGSLLAGSGDVSSESSFTHSPHFAGNARRRPCISNIRVQFDAVSCMHGYSVAARLGLQLTARLSLPISAQRISARQNAAARLLRPRELPTPDRMPR